MMDFIKNNWKWIITTIVALLAATIPLFTHWASFEIKSLSYVIVSKSPLILAEEKNEDLVVKFKGEKVSDPYLTVIKITNTGETPIRSEDFESPIKISLGNDINILSKNIVEKSPDSLLIKATIINKSLLIDPTLLNPSDSFTIKLITSNNEPDIYVSARISGIKEITTIQDNNTELLLVKNVFYLIWVVLIGICYSVITTALIRKDGSTNTVIFPYKTAIFFLFVTFTPAAFIVIEVTEYLNYSWPGFFLIIFLMILLGEIFSYLFKLHYKRIKPNNQLQPNANSGG